MLKDVRNAGRHRVFVKMMDDGLSLPCKKVSVPGFFLNIEFRNETEPRDEKDAGFNKYKIKINY